MYDSFNKAFKESKCDWLSYIGEPMIYDGNLCVVREEIPKDELILLTRNKLLYEARARSDNRPIQPNTITFDDLEVCYE